MLLRFASCVVAAGFLAAQPFPAHVVMDSLLRIRFYPATGGFSMDSPIPVLFPPPGETPARLLIKKSGGGTVVTKDVVIRPWAPHDAFGEMRAKDNQDQFGPIPPGDYVMSVELKGKEISAYAFSMKPQASPDPFNPKTEMVRTGPWSKAAFLTVPVDGPAPLAGIGLYISTREFPGFVLGKPASFTVHLLRGGTQLGLIESTAHVSDWTFFKEDFQVGRGKGFVKWSDVTATAGAYTVEVRSGGKTIRGYKFNVAGGKVALIPANEPSFAGTGALPAQTLLRNRRTQAFWLAGVE